MKSPFRFKEFTISDSQCCMKISTDAVLLGAFADVTTSSSILDIGTGSGIIALMLAQRSDAIIDAVEIDEDSEKQASENFAISKWANQLRLFHDSIQHFANSGNQTYDTIVCNPPYFHNQLKSTFQHRNTSKHDTNLSFEELSVFVKKLLSDTGHFWVIIPVSEKQHFLNIFANAELFCKKAINIIDNPDKDTIRIIYCFSKQIPEKTETTLLYIKNRDNSFSNEFIDLTRDFYLNF